MPVDKRKSIRTPGYEASNELESAWIELGVVSFDVNPAAHECEQDCDSDCEECEHYEEKLLSQNRDSLDRIVDELLAEPTKRTKKRRGRKR